MVDTQHQQAVHGESGWLLGVHTLNVYVDYGVEGYDWGSCQDVVRRPMDHGRVRVEEAQH